MLRPNCFSLILPPGFSLAVGVFIVNQLLEARGIYIPYVHSYLDDVLALPIMMCGMLMIQQQITYRNPKYTFSIWHILFMVALLSWYFEWYAPGRKANHYADVFDVAAYAIGGVGFYIWQNVPARGWVRYERRYPFLRVVPNEN